MSRTDKQLAGDQRRTLRSMTARLLRMADAWDGVDEFNRMQLNELADQAERVGVDMVAEANDAP